MNVLALGNLGPNQDRIVAFSRLGHKLVYGYVDFAAGLAQLEPEVYCVPLARRGLPNQVRRLVAQHDIDVIYCLLNSYDGSTEVVLELLDAGIEKPIVRHYKEHPCVPDRTERRTLTETDAQIYTNEQSLEYFRTVYGVHLGSAHIMDGDLIAEHYMTDDFADKLRSEDGEPHLLVAGSLSRMSDRYDVRELCIEMARRRVHVHLYGSFIGEDEHRSPVMRHEPTQRSYERLASSLQFTHLHNRVVKTQFTSRWSCYDAGVLHMKVDSNDKAAAFARMNYPHRYSAYLAAGLPLVVQKGGQEAMEALVNQHEIGIIFKDYDDLAEKLHDDQHLHALTQRVLQRRNLFSFDRQLPHLVGILGQYARL